MLLASKMPLIGMLCLISFLATIGSAASQCSSIQLQCDDGTCINREAWCDRAQHCNDSSDETYCEYLGTKIECLPELHFKCVDGSCIPKLGRCNSLSDCKDGSDEQNCELKLEALVQNDDSYFTGDFDLIDPITLSMNKASNWLLSQLGSDYGWGKDTPRAIVALALASTVPLNQSIKDTMAKQLHVLLNLELTKSGANQDMDLSHLSLFINSLLAICEDPRSFQGFDLVGQLRTRANQLMRNSKFVLPSAFLTLCMANETADNDLLAVRSTYEDFRGKTSMLDTQALLIMAMSCMSKLNRHKTRFQAYFQRALEDFKTKFSTLEIYDHYKIALAIQALNSVGDKSTLLAESMKLSDRQLDDGSFFDVLGTYLALPALAGKSLLDIKQTRCSASDNANGNVVLQPAGDISTVKYSLWMGKSGVPDSHTISISFSGNQSLYDIMKLAESRNSLLRFSFDDTEHGKMVYSLAGIPNDVERDQHWETYVNRMDVRMVVNTNTNLTPYHGGIDKLRPSNRSHIVFWLRQGKN